MELNFFSNQEPEPLKNNETEINQIKGLKLIENFLSADEELELINNIENENWLNDLKRRVQHFGYKYDYKSRRIDTNMKIGELPIWGKEIAEKLFKKKIFDKIPDQLIVNEYQIGQGISAHIDCEPCFENTIVSISLMSPVIMNFTNLDKSKNIPILLNRRSVVVLKEESRYLWKHSISSRKTDKFQGKLIKRKRRISLTFRNVILSP